MAHQPESQPFYITDSLLTHGRRNMELEDEKARIKAKWSVTEEDEASRGMCGNIRATFVDNVAHLDDILSSLDKTPSYHQISSPLALYRTISFFECGLNPRRVEFYKTNWEVTVQHRETGIHLTLGEWKGAFQIFTPFHGMSDFQSPRTQAYKADVEELLTLLVSPDFTIGYDGTIAGTVA